MLLRVHKDHLGPKARRDHLGHPVPSRVRVAFILVFSSSIIPADKRRSLLASRVRRSMKTITVTEGAWVAIAVIS
jgi:hypothetical protein